MRTFQKGELDRMSKLVPSVRKRLLAGLSELYADGLDFVVRKCLETPEENQAEVAAGRSATTKSWHQVGRAVDLYYRKPGGGVDVGATNTAAYERMHVVMLKHGGHNLGMKPIKGRKGSFTDPYHIQWTDGLKWSQAFKAYWGKGSGNAPIAPAGGSIGLLAVAAAAWYLW